MHICKRKKLKSNNDRQQNSVKQLFFNKKINLKILNSINVSRSFIQSERKLVI